MYRAEVRALLRRLGRAAGLPEDLAGSLSPHSMRHPLATLNQFQQRACRSRSCAAAWATPPLRPLRSTLLADKVAGATIRAASRLS
jgi:hypothetical protein